MSLSIQSSIHAVAKASHDVEPVSAKKTADQSAKTSTPTSKAPITAPKPAPKLDERAQIQQLALQGHSNVQIAATVGLPGERCGPDAGRFDNRKRDDFIGLCPGGVERTTVCKRLILLTADCSIAFVRCLLDGLNDHSVCFAAFG